MPKTFDPINLASRLAGDMGIAKFNHNVREKKTAHFPSAIPSELLQHFFQLSRIEEALITGEIPIEHVDAYHAGQLIKVADLASPGKSNVFLIQSLFDCGHTIRIRDLQKFDPLIAEFTAAVQQQLSAQVQINLYLTPSEKAGFPPHWDIMDVFVLQCAGRKEWKLFHEYHDTLELPLSGTPWEPQRYIPYGNPNELEMRPGDTLYLPRGAMHQASCGDFGSAHLAIGIDPLTYADFLCQEIRRLASEDVSLRRRIPWSSNDTHQMHTALETEVNTLMHNLAKKINLPARLAKEQAKLHVAKISTLPTRIFSAIDEG